MGEEPEEEIKTFSDAAASVTSHVESEKAAAA
jgi:hypothetical protein